MDADRDRLQGTFPRLGQYRVMPERPQWHNASPSLLPIHVKDLDLLT
jgi:hypothetical protein